MIQVQVNDRRLPSWPAETARSTPAHPLRQFVDFGSGYPILSHVLLMFDGDELWIEKYGWSMEIMTALGKMMVWCSRWTVLPKVPWHLKRCKRYYPPTSRKSYSPGRWRQHNLPRHPWNCWTTSQCGPKRSSSGCRWWQSWPGYLVVDSPPDKTNCSTVIYIYVIMHICV